MLPALSSRRFTFPMLSAPTVLRQEVDNLFERCFGSFASNGDAGLSRGWTAPVAIWDDDQHVYVEVEVPGLCRDDIEVVVHQGSLRIWGERKAAEDNRNYWYNERNFGRFERLITLPDVVDSETIEAEMRDGILSVKLMKLPEAQPKKIAIKGG